MTPHVTVLGAGADERVRFEPFAIPLVGLADSDSPTRCITVTATPVGPLLAIRAQALVASEGDAPSYEPHLSLLYAELAAERRAELRESITLELPTTITIDAVALVDTTAKDHTQWRELWRLPAGPPG